MKKKGILLILLLCTIFTTSCWSRKEIEDLGFVVGLGISKTDEGLYSLIAQVANPSAIVSEAPDPRSIYTIIKSEGLTVFDALRNMTMISKRRLFISHVNLVVIHETIAKEGLRNVMSFLLQDMEVRLEMKILISKIPPEDILDTPNYLSIIPAIGLSRMTENYGGNSKVYIADLHETIEVVNNPPINYVTTLVEKRDPPSEHEKQHLTLSQIAVFANDKLKGYLDYEEGQGYNFITNNYKNALITFKCNTNKERLVIEVLESTTKIYPNYSDGKISFHIDVKVTGNVAERFLSEDSPQELDVSAVANQLDEVIEDKINRAITTAQQKYKIDYFNLSKNFSRKYPREFKALSSEWNQIFSSADITVKVESSIIHSALNLNRGLI